MKATTNILLLAIIVLLTSCTNVYYEAPQPAGQVNLTEFPKKLVGLYSVSLIKFNTTHTYLSRKRFL